MEKMEGLIPFVIQAFRRNRMLQTYRSLSMNEGSNRGETASLMHELQQQQKEGSSHHRRTRSEYSATFATSSTSDYHLSSGGATHRHVAASRGMAEDAFRATARGGGHGVISV